jgi:hypothetical protein
MPFLSTLGVSAARGRGFGGIAALFPFSSATFTSGGVQGRSGPSLTQARAGLTGTDTELWKNNTTYFNTTNGIQLWTVPVNGTYRIETWGAQGAGGGYTGGFGARMRGDFGLTQGQVIKILVGQQGSGSYPGGAGGTFVATSANSPLIVAGGGNNGSPWSSTVQHGTTSTSGTGSSVGNAGTGGNGGSSSAGAFGGAGFNSNAQGSDSCSGTRPVAFVNGGTGGFTCNSDGGFGGGSGTDGCCYGAGGAGGGYSGGGGTSSSSQYGGAGGSFNSGANQSNANGNSGTANLTGAGQVIITLL